MSFSSRKLQQELLAIKQQQELLEKEQKLEQQRQEQEVERHRREQQLPPLRGKDRGRESKRHQGNRRALFPNGKETMNRGNKPVETALV